MVCYGRSIASIESKYHSERFSDFREQRRILEPTPGCSTMEEAPSKMQKTTVATESSPSMAKAEETSPAQDAGAMDLGLTKKLPSLPFVNMYDNGPSYYVRACYEEYYAIVKKMLDDEVKCVTVTGTPGELCGGYWPKEVVVVGETPPESDGGGCRA
jgi:hypothetical protein